MARSFYDIADILNAYLDDDRTQPVQFVVIDTHGDDTYTIDQLIDGQLAGKPRYAILDTTPQLPRASFPDMRITQIRYARTTYAGPLTDLATTELIHSTPWGCTLTTTEAEDIAGAPLTGDLMTIAADLLGQDLDHADPTGPTTEDSVLELAASIWQVPAESLTLTRHCRA